MAQDIEMPALGESVTEGTVSRWLKKVGDQVAVDEPLLEVSTDKVDSEVPSPIAGVITEILVEEDETVDVGTVVCRVGEAGEVGSDAPASSPEPQTQDTPAPSIPATPPMPETPAGGSAPAGGGQAVEMPALGESVTEGTVSRWLKKVGDKVEVDEPLLEVSTDKVDSEVPSPIAGVVTEILVQEDETVDVGTVLCRVGDGAAAPAETSAPAAPEASAASAASAAPAAPAVPAAPPAPSLPDNLEELPGAGIPSSIKREGDHHVVQWAYPQVHTGYPGTMTAQGQVVPPSDNAPAVPAAPAAPAAPPAPKAAETPAAPKPPAAPPAPAAPKAPAAPTPPAAAPSAKPEDKPQAAKQVSGGYVTPIVRKLAREKGVDISSLKGSGVGGRIRREDVLAAAQKPPAEPAAAPEAPAATLPPIQPAQERGKTEKLSRMRQTIAKHMMNSLASTAQLTTVVEVDVTRIANLRARAKDSFAQREGTKLSFLPFFVKAAVEALKAHPKINSRVNDETNEVTYFDHENVGIAVDSDKGLMVPVIKYCGDLTIAAIARKINELAAKVRDGSITIDEMSGGTFSITNTGSRGALFDTPVVNYPEEAILGLGTIVRRPMVVKDSEGNDTIAVRSLVYLALSYDHRLIDGADAARYLTTVKKRLEEGDFSAEVGL
ncbi:2-oxoglutarate dehydrogenase, E2 component, dihydrolipoamide succinyltransferase [Varibaculum cambriense]|uniref:2-oxoglutarate dehydrogenase, E2 component, dihydrolipoamide succinyltransferase n=1 Tax=Varibaculum cambriense TaxID=184870 RepID=UPI0028FF9253|nr:2-oxoglutarate dehydrogenase, E2 component, dihydrolipoamide succinyltransferase [Varibaculum cambriense]MDU1224893.1 2-oxoglutarate dehydrogenase, E2 component, dihydrolipoamide succinyltransferase [Varibaculum cambriense]